MRSDPNARYLADALAWLRLRLEAGDLEETERLRKQMLEHETCNPQPELVFLGERLGLSRFERDTVLLCLAFELDASFGRALADGSGPPPTAASFGLALSALEGGAWDALTPASPLRYWRLVEPSDHAADPLTQRPLRVDEWVLHLAKGIVQLDPRVARIVSPPTSRRGDAVALPASVREKVDHILEVLREAPPGAPLLVQLVGSDSASKQLVVEAAAWELGRRLHLVSPRLLPDDPSELEVVARVCDRQTAVDAVTFLMEAEAGGVSAQAARFARRVQGLFFVDTEQSDALSDRTLLTVDVGRPSAAEQRRSWIAILGEAEASLAGRLASQFDLSLTALRAAARDAMGRARESDVPLGRSVWDACLRATRPRTETLAQRIDPKATWDDIVLPEQAAEQLRRISGQVATRARVYDDWGFRDKLSRGLGVTALFCGESGTGKTMAAEVLANELRVDLYRIDLSGVVSKFIGETEKNLRRLFDAADAGGAILLFDEADALFGKRSEVRDSHDRYANIEIDYLLQRVEEYRGLAILATNVRSALDSAFTRRLRFVVPFEHPDQDMRRRIWERAFPGGVPTHGLDLERLSLLNVTGAHIRNIALAATFRAAEDDTPVTMERIAEAARLELGKMDLPVAEVAMLAPDTEEGWS